MFNKILSHIICILSSIYIKSVIKNIPTKGDYTMKCVCTIKGFEIAVKVNEAGKVHQETTNGDVCSSATVTKSDYKPVADFTIKLGESTSDLDMDKEEFIEINKLITEDGKSFRDNCLVPFIKGLDKYADRCMTALEAQWAQTREENKAIAEKELKADKA